MNSFPQFQNLWNANSVMKPINLLNYLIISHIQQTGSCKTQEKQEAGWRHLYVYKVSPIPEKQLPSGSGNLPCQAGALVHLQTAGLTALWLECFLSAWVYSIWDLLILSPGKVNMKQIVKCNKHLGFSLHFKRLMSTFPEPKVHLSLLPEAAWSIVWVILLYIYYFWAKVRFSSLQFIKFILI